MPLLLLVWFESDRGFGKGMYKKRVKVRETMKGECCFGGRKRRGLLDVNKATNGV